MMDKPLNHIKDVLITATGLIAVALIVVGCFFIGVALAEHIQDLGKASPQGEQELRSALLWERIKTAELLAHIDATTRCQK